MADNTTQILQQLATINAFLQGIVNKAKNLSDFESATDLSPTDLVHVSQGGVDKKAQLSLIISKLAPVHAQIFEYTSPNNTFTTDHPINEIIDIQIEFAPFFDGYATVANGNEVTIEDTVLMDGNKVKIIYK